MGKTCTGIDIGNDYLAMAVCDNGVVQKVILEPLPEGLKAEGRLVSVDAAADFVKRVSREYGGVSKNVALVLPATESLTRRLDMPAMTDKELEINLPYEFRDFISQGKDRYFYDYAVLETHVAEDGTPVTLDLLAAAAGKDVMEDYTNLMRRAGLKLVAAMPAAAALQNLVRGKATATNSCYIDFSYLSTNLHFFKGGKYDIARVIETGAIDIDRAIAVDMNIDDHVARTYRRSNFEDVLASQPALEVYERIAIELQRAFNFYEFNNPDSTIESVFYGGTNQGIQELIDTVSQYVDLELQPVSALLDVKGDLSELAVECPAAIGATIGVK